MIRGEAIRAAARPAAWMASPSARNDGGGIWRTYFAECPNGRHQPSRRSSGPSIRCGAGAIRAAFARLRGVGLGKGAIRGMTPDDEIRPRALALEHFDVDGGCLARRLGSGFGWRDSSICMHWGLRHFQRSRPSRPALSACHALVLRWGVFRRPDVELRSHLRPLARSKIQAIRPTPIATGRRKGRVVERLRPARRRQRHKPAVSPPCYASHDPGGLERLSSGVEAVGDWRFRVERC